MSRPNLALSAYRSGRSRCHSAMYHPAVRRAPHPQRDETLHAAHACAAATRLGILSRKACNRHDIAHSLHQNDIFCAFSVQKRQGTDRDRILLRESMPISCHEERETSFKVRPIGPERAFRYPIDTLPIPGFREIRSRFASQLDALGQILDSIGPTLAHVRDAADKETDAISEFNPDFDPGFDTRRRYGPRRGPLLAHRSRTPQSSQTSNPLPKTPVQQGKNQVDVPCFHDDVRAMLAHRARLPSQHWRENPA